MHETIKITIKIHPYPIMFVKFVQMHVKIAIIHEIIIKNIELNSIFVWHGQYPIFAS